MIARASVAAIFMAVALAGAQAQDAPPAPPALKERVLLSFPFGQSPTSGLTVGPDRRIFGAGGARIYELYQDASDVWRTRTIFEATQTAITGVIQLDYAGGEIYGLSTFGAANCSRFSGPGCGFLFTLAPTADPAIWTRSSLFEFPGDKAGRYPVGFAIDPSGDVIVATREGGGSRNCGMASDEPNGCGTVMRLMRSGANWTHKVLQKFQGGTDGRSPDAGPAVDAGGAIYQTTRLGGGAPTGDLAPPPVEGGDGFVTLIKNARKARLSGELARAYGRYLMGAAVAIGLARLGPGGREERAARGPARALTTALGGGRSGFCPSSGNDGCGVVFSLSQPSDDSFPWRYKAVHRFSGRDGDGPYGAWLTAGKASYGVTRSGGNCSTSGGCGVVFSVTRTETGWTYDGTVHRFAGGAADGRQPWDRMVKVGSTIFGTTRFGGTADAGVVYALEK